MLGWGRADPTFEEMRPMREPTVADIRRQIEKLEAALRAAAQAASRDRAWKLGSAADLLTEVRACELRGLR